MTAVNMIALPDRVHLFGDGSVYDADGALIATVGKIHLMSSLGAAMLMSGRAIAAPFIAYMLERQVESFDELHEHIADLLPQIEVQAEMLHGEDEEGFRLLFGGWSEAKAKPIAFAIATINSQTHEAFTVIELSNAQTPVLTPDEIVRGFGRPLSMDDVVEDIEALALRVLELQRLQPWPDGSYKVGGFAELCTITRDRLEFKILKRWQDKIGEPIKPAPVTAWPDWRQRGGAQLIQLSRLQREIAERKAKKAQRRGHG